MMEAGILATNGVDPGNVRRGGAGCIEVPVADLVLLGVEIFLRARAQGGPTHSSNGGP